MNRFLLPLSLLLLSIAMAAPRSGAAATNLIVAAGDGVALTAYCTHPFDARRIMPDDDGASALATGLDAVAARGASEALSLVVRSPAAVQSLSIEVADLVAGDKTLPANIIDIRIVKVWYQSGNAWFTEIADHGRPVLVPELLLHNDNLVRTDPKARSNLVLSKGQHLPCTQAGLVADDDAATLQPFTLAAGAARQLFVGITVPRDAAPGYYTGRLTFEADGRPAGYMPVALRVLPYVLPPPRARFSDRPFVYYAPAGLGSFTTPPPSDFRPITFATTPDYRQQAHLHKVHLFTQTATLRQLEPVRAIGAMALDAAPPLPGIENPAVWRRKKGIIAFLAGYDGIYLAAITDPVAPWNEAGRPVYRSRSLLYPTATAALHTLASEALRAAATDVAYLSYLHTLAQGLLAADDHTIVVEGRRALAWTEDISKSSPAPDTVRLDAIAWIERLRQFAPSRPDALACTGGTHAAPPPTATASAAVKAARMPPP
ncbi:MAG: hypothetical protein GX174_03600 [Lentisphaerae bacterium]|jgi:hypothetical protein|nr:hypothetical protein [Lentisphaerota bacterium]